MLVDIPKDPLRTFSILELAKAKSMNKQENEEIDYYLNYFKKIHYSQQSN